MADDRGEIRHVNWAELFSFTQIFKGFRLAIHPSKMVLAFAAIALTWLAAQGLQYAWKLSATHGYVMPARGNDPGEIAMYAQPGDRVDKARQTWLDSRANNAKTLMEGAQENMVAGLESELGMLSSKHHRDACQGFIRDKKNKEADERAAAAGREARGSLAHGGHFPSNFRELICKENFAGGTLGDEHSGQQDEKYISRVNDYRYATTDMQKPQTAKSWVEMPKNAGEWFRNLEETGQPNPFAAKDVKPYRPGK